MKKIFLFLLLGLYAWTATAQQQYPQEALQKIADAACKCFDKADMNALTDEQQAELQACFGVAIISHAADLGISLEELSGADAGEKLGYMVGQQLAPLLLKDCPNFVAFSLKIAEKQKQASKPASEQPQTVSGKFTGVEKGSQYVFITLETNGGEKFKFIWLKEFANWETLNDSKQKGKSLTISYTNSPPLYQEKSRSYESFKEIVGIEW
jgi:hypothetical protein